VYTLRLRHVAAFFVDLFKLQLHQFWLHQDLMISQPKNFNCVCYIYEAADLAQNHPLWRMMSTYGATQS